jgi:predicted DNA-binding transcriptional regulator YafY
VLLGIRRYLVAREEGKTGPMQHFRVDRIAKAAILPASFQRDPNFDLSRHAALAFGSFHDAREYGEVVWRFLPQAADVARDFLFHPDQELTEEPDGSLIVRFRASGHLEMAWHLYTWGDSVEVIAPDRLRAMVEGYRRKDFKSLP